MTAERFSCIVSRSSKFFILVTACGCGGTTDEGTSVFTPTRPPETLALAERLASEIAPLNISNSTTVQALGTATFRGTVSGLISQNANSDTPLVGLLSIDAQLSGASSTFSGQASGFITADSVEVPGQLVLGEAIFAPDTDTALDYSFSSVMVGELDLPDLGQTDFNIKLEGDFFGTDASYVGGGAFGIGITQGSNVKFRGRFVATTN